MKALLLSMALSAAFAAPAFAQSETDGTQTEGAAASDTSASGMSEQNRVSADRLRQQLTSAGFQDVQILDAAYLVQAKTDEGNTVLMMINPSMASGAAGMDGSSGTSGSSGTTGTDGSSGSGESGSGSNN